jgi:hypothetical protein
MAASKPIRKLAFPERQPDEKPLEGRNPKTGRFLKGYKGGNGRKPGTRRDLEFALVDEFVKHFEQKGAVAIDRVWRDDPSTYLRVAAGLLPKELKVNVSHRLSIEEFAERFRDLIARANAPLIEGQASQTTLDLKSNPIEDEDEP